MTNRIEEENKARLIQSPANSIVDQDENQNDHEIKPISSRVKKVLFWDSKEEKFKMPEKDIDDLTKNHIQKPQQWEEFKGLYSGLNPRDHPSRKGRSCCLGSFLGIFALFICVLIAYVMFVILQLALFNLIMLVVMMVWWFKLCKMCWAVISRCLDSRRKKAFKSYIHRIKDLAWLKELNIEIQENDEGKWIEIHLNEAADEQDNGNHEDEDLLKEHPDEDD
jgi:hypothetical protein